MQSVKLLAEPALTAGTSFRASTQNVIDNSNSFSAILKSLSSSESFPLPSSEGGSIDISKALERVGNNQKLDSRQLLLYQLKVNELHVQVELVSKLADSLFSTVRRLQQGN